MATKVRTKPPVRRKQLATDAPRVLPSREWDRGTELVRLFVATGAISNSRPQSLMLVSDPGSGKTELLERFRVNRILDFHSDLTVRQLYPILKKVQRGQTTHVVLTEFQKLFMRKASVAENLLGTLVQGMEEGVGVVSVGPETVDYGGVRIGVVAAITNGTIKKRREMLSEMGFLSRAACFEWDVPSDEERGIMRRISEGDYSDIKPVKLVLPDRKIPVDIPPTLSHRLEEYTIERMQGRALRFFNRLRALVQGSALLEGRDVVTTRDVEWILAFDPYWRRLIDY